MPRVNEDLVRVVVYLYPSRHHAIDAAKAGGTGFVVRLQTELTYYHYVITNRHIVEDADSRFARVNTFDKKKPIDIFEGDWECSTTDDIAACELPLHSAHFRYHPISMDSLVTKNDATNLRIGLGDDLFMVGRFINHDGKERNTPVVRFGTIAMMPEEPIIADGRAQESFLIEIRTIPGFSGSPVFIHMPGDTRSKDSQFKPSIRDQKFIQQYGYLERCLGIEWCRVKGETAATPLINGATFDIQLTSGMSGCIPAWKIIDFVKTNEKFAMKRKETEKQILADNELRENQAPIEYTGAKPDKATQEPRH